MILKVNKDICEIKQNEVWNVGDYNVHTVQVELSEEFDGLVNKVRYFTENNSYDMLITDNIAEVPYEATLTEGTIKIGVYGYDADTDILVQSTSPVNKYITSGTYTGNPDNTQPLTPTDKEQMETAIQKNTNDITDLKANKQDKLISGVNIKTINNESILSGGNLTLVTEETDPIFTNSPAYSITDNDITYWNNKANMSDIPDVSNFITKDVDNLTYYTKSTDMQTAINNAVSTERTARENADNSLQNQIDAITVSSDVIDILGTYQDLQNYDTQHVKANDIIKVLQDSTHNNAMSYYRWVITDHVGAWVYVGSEGPYYTKSESDVLLNAKQNEITSSNMLASDLVDDTNQTNQFVTTAEKTTWNNKLDQSDLTGYVKNTDYATSSTAGVFKKSINYGFDMSNDGYLLASVHTLASYNSSSNNLNISKGTLENVITGKGLIDSSYHDSTKQNVTDESLNTVNKNIVPAINEVDSIAKGANQALSYGNYSAMVTAFNSLANNVYNVGQNVMIITLQVPDLWISGIESTSSTYTYTTDEAITTALSTNGYIQVGYYKLSALETQKVDLTDYATKTYVNNLFNSIVDGDEVSY